MKNNCITALIMALLAIPPYFMRRSHCAVGVNPEIQYVDTTRIFNDKPRILDVVLWYPTNKTVESESRTYGIWKLEDAAIDGPINGTQKLPLIIFSHGFGGDLYGNSWFAHYLASHGYIVACIKHYGNAYNNIIPEISARPWNRPLDMSFVLDHLLADNRFKDYIDVNRIGAAGFSQGGITALWLAGIKAHVTPKSLHEHMITIKDTEWRSLFEHYTSHDIAEANKSYRDKRIKAVLAMAPGIDYDNWMFSQEGLSSVHIPVCLIVGDTDTVVSADAYTKFFAKHISSAQLVVLQPHITHWVFMNESSDEGKKISPTITIDHPSVNRAAIHEHVGNTALQFFDKNLN